MTSSTTTASPQTAVRRPFGGGTAIAPRTDVQAGGRVVAWATTQLLPDTDADGAMLTIHIQCVEGHQPPWARRILVHDLLNRAHEAGIRRVLMVAPLGDTEIPDALREHCDAITTRAAGTSCILEAEIGPAPRPLRAG